MASVFETLDGKQKELYLSKFREILNKLPDECSTEEYEAIRNGFDDANAKLFEDRQFADRIQCTKGCSFCCFIHVDINGAEAKDLVKELDKKQVQQLKEQNGYSLDNWRKLKYSKRKCVFLKNGECSVYEKRPISCRKHFSASKPRLCNTEFKVHKTLNVGNAHAEIIQNALFSKYGHGTMSKMLLKELENEVQD